MGLANTNRRLVSTVQDGVFPCMLRRLGDASSRRKVHHERERSFAGRLAPLAHGCRKSARGECVVRSMSVSRSGGKASGLTQEAFDNLLHFLGPTPEEAGRRYEEIRRRLIKIFASRGCATPEELVDESIDRVARKAAELAPTYEGDPALYFYGVAKRVYLESVKPRPAVVPPPEPDTSQTYERELACLDDCMNALPPDQRALIHDYYREDKAAKIEHRKALATRLGVGINALRIRAHRIRAELQKCVDACLAREDVSC